MKTAFALVAATAALMIAGTASAADNEAGTYGNTVVCTYPDGAQTKVYMEKGGSYTLSRGGQTVHGTWTDDGSNVCYNDTDPAPPPGTKNVCVPTRAFKVGDTWTVTDPMDHTCHAVLEAGHK